MPKYKPALSITKIPKKSYKHLQIGQWVYAGDKNSEKGVFVGVTEKGNARVVWYKNLKQYPSYNDAVKVLVKKYHLTKGQVSTESNERNSERSEGFCEDSGKPPKIEKQSDSIVAKHFGKEAVNHPDLFDIQNDYLNPEKIFI